MELYRGIFNSVRIVRNLNCFLKRIGIPCIEGEILGTLKRKKCG